MSVDPILALLTGNFSKETFTAVPQNVPKGKLKIIFSSTFTDTSAERNLLMDEIYPYLQSAARQNGIVLVIVDMRYGVKDENTSDHLTWIACAEQIRICYEESDQLFFISLQGDKYGYMPIPKFLPGAPILIRMREWDGETRALFDKWYKVDSNQAPPHFVLTNLTGHKDTDKAYWTDVLPRLRKALEGIPFDRLARDDIIVGRSVTEYETRLAEALDETGERRMWFRRIFHRPFSATEDLKGDFCDFIVKCNDTDADKDIKDAVRSKFNTLISSMESTYRKENIIFLECNSVESYEKEDEDFCNYLDEWKHAVTMRLEAELYRAITKKASWALNGDGRGVPGAEIEEMIHHCKLLEAQSSLFFGRETLIKQATETILAGLTVDVGRTTDICLCIIGVSGVGKTALMSVLAKNFSQIYSSSGILVPVIVRYCGTSQGSVDGLALILNICLQIQLVYSLARESIPIVYADATKYLHSLLKSYPVLLFIDSLDQLSDVNQARSKLSFLDGVQCHPESRIIVSTLPDDKDKVTGQWGRYVYLCDARLKEFNVPRLIVNNFENNEEQARTIVTGLLHSQLRVLTTAQMNYVLAAAEAEPTVLYISLASIIASQWTSECLPLENITQSSLISTLSDQRTLCKLQPTVRGVIDQIFNSLERNYGRQLVRFSIGFITFARAGKN